MNVATTIADVLSISASLYPNKEAIVFQSQRLTYAQVHEKACRLSNILIANGVKTGNKIGVQLSRSPEYVIAYFAVALTGAVIVPLNPSLTQTETYRILNYCDVELLISRAIVTTNLEDLSRNCPKLQVILSFGQDDAFIPNHQTFLEIKFIDNLLSQSPTSAPTIQIDPDDLALLLHTSGTTSAPKRVMLSHRNVLVNAKSHIASLKLQHEDKVLIALPMFFGYCNTAQMLTHILLGGTLVLLPGTFTPRQFCRLVEMEKITTFTGVPTMLFYLLNYKHLYRYNLSSLRCICFGGSVMPHETLMQLTKAFPQTGFVQTYGQTEASPRITTLLPEDIFRKPGSVGKPIPKVDLYITDNVGNHLSPFEIGEIVVRGENVMLGYYKRPDATNEVIQNGHLLTGDMGYLDDEGYLYLAGRKKNMIIRGGMNVYVEEVEEYLMEHPDIIEVAIVGEDHPLQGEVPVAIVVTRNGCNLSEVDLIAHCKKGLASHKIPIRIEFRTNSLPKTYNRKVQRYNLVTHTSQII